MEYQDLWKEMLSWQVYYMFIGFAISVLGSSVFGANEARFLLRKYGKWKGLKKYESTLAVSADAHAGIQSASGKSSVPTAIAENESGAVTSAKASVGKSRKAKASVNAVADSGLYQVKIAGDICPSAGSRAMDLINQYREANGKSRIVQDNTYERMAITRAGEISVYYNLDSRESTLV